MTGAPHEPSAPRPSAPPRGGADDGLLAAMLAGDDRAYERAVRTHAAAMLATARRLLRNEADAHDVVQEAFVSAWKALPTFRAGVPLASWLQRITANAALMRMRARGSRKEANITDLLPKYLDDGHQIEPSAPWREGADAASATAEDCRLVRAAIDRLPETYRSVLLLRDIEGLNTDEAADLLQVTANAVKIRLHRARQALRALLEPHYLAVL